MKRENKFRAWDKKAGKMLYTVLFYLGKNRKMAFEFMDKKNKESYQIEMDDVFGNSEDYVVMPYLGLRDKQGKEIYEGDVVKVGANNREVKFGLHVIEIASPKYDDERGDYFRAYGFYMKEEYSGYTSIEEYSSDSQLVRKSNDQCCEIVGNVYENSNLSTTLDEKV